MNPLKNNLMVIFIITCLLFKSTICDGNDNSCHADHNDLIVVSKTQIRIFSKDKTISTMKIGLPSKSAAAFDPTKNYVYVSDEQENTGRIFRIKTNEDTVKDAIPIVARKDWLVKGLAYYHPDSMLYWTTAGSIYKVQVPDGEISATHEGELVLYVEKPTDITIDVQNRKLYWVNQCTTSSKIEQSLLDGSDRVTVADYLSDPKSITVDSETNRLYWTEVSLRGYRSLNTLVNGTKTPVFQGTEEFSPDIIALHGQNVYWIDSMLGNLRVMPKDSSNPPQSVCKDKVYDTPIRMFVLCGK